MEKLTPVLLCLLLMLSCGRKQDADKAGGLIFKMDESSPEYHAMALDFIKGYLAAKSSLVDTIKIETNKLYIRFRGADSTISYTEFARDAGMQFNQFKLKKVGYTGVVVYCITDKGTVAHAIVQ